MEQLLPLLWTGVWLGRSVFAACKSPFALLDAEKHAAVFWRIAMAVVGFGMQTPYLYYYCHEPLFRHIRLLLIVYERCFVLMRSYDMHTDA